MTSQSRALVVAPTPAIARSVVAWLAARGHDVLLLTEFAAARQELVARPPSLLITELKLGAFNGLHLTRWGRARCAGVAAIVIGDADRVLQDEAQQQQVHYLVLPFDERAFADALPDVYAPPAAAAMLSEADTRH